MRLQAAILVAAASLVGQALGSLAWAQQAPQPQPRSSRDNLVTITGRVLFASGMCEVSGVQVRLLQGLGMPLQQTYTDAQGAFELRSLQRGVYIVEAEQEGYSVARQSVDLSQMWGAQVRLTMLLQPASSPAAASPPGITASVRELQIPAKARQAFEKGLRELNVKNRPAWECPAPTTTATAGWTCTSRISPKMSTLCTATMED